MTSIGDDSTFSGLTDSTLSTKNNLADLYFSSPHFSYKSHDSKNEFEKETLLYLLKKNESIKEKSNKFTVSFKK
jgi:hypothetical protein